jgi:hypothetical protein
MKSIAVMLCLSAFCAPVRSLSAQTGISVEGMTNLSLILGNGHSETTGPAFTFEEAERMALERNPEIAVATRRIAMAQAGVPAAGVLDHPEFMYRGWGVPLNQPQNYNAAQNVFMMPQALPGRGKRAL